MKSVSAVATLSFLAAIFLCSTANAGPPSQGILDAAKAQYEQLEIAQYTSKLPREIDKVPAIDVIDDLDFALRVLGALNDLTAAGDTSDHAMELQRAASFAIKLVLCKLAWSLQEGTCRGMSIAKLTSGAIALRAFIAARYFLNRRLINNEDPSVVRLWLANEVKQVYEKSLREFDKLKDEVLKFNAAVNAYTELSAQSKKKIQEIEAEALPLFGNFKTLAEMPVETENALRELRKRLQSIEGKLKNQAQNLTNSNRLLAPRVEKNTHLALCHFITQIMGEYQLGEFPWLVFVDEPLLLQELLPEAERAVAPALVQWRLLDGARATLIFRTPLEPSAPTPPRNRTAKEGTGAVARFFHIQ